MDRPYLLLVLTTAFWGGNLVAGKLAIGHVDPFMLTTLRWAGGLLAVLPFALGGLRTDWTKIKANWLLLGFYGAIGFCAFNVLMYLAFHYTSGVNASIEHVTINIMVMIGNFIIFKVRVRPLQIAGVILTFFGVALTATHGDLTRLLDLDINFGDGLVLLACAAYAAYSLTLRYRPAIGWKSFLVATFFGALIAAVGFQLTIGGGGPAFLSALPQITPQGWLVVLYVVIFPSIVAQVLYVRGVELIGPNRASLFINLIPLFGTLGSVVVLGEVLEGFHLVAAGLVVAGIVLAEYSVRRK